MSQPEPETQETAPTPLKPWHKRRLILVLVLSAFVHFGGVVSLKTTETGVGDLHLPHPFKLASIPRVYSDEGLQAQILRDFVSGHMRVESITWTGFSAFHPYPLLFYVVTAPLFLILRSVLAARIVTAAGGVLSTWLIFRIGQRMKDARTGLWSAFFFTMMPFETLFARWGFVHALAMVFVVLAFYHCVLYRLERRRRSAVVAGLAAGLATVTAYWAGPIAVLVFVFLLFLNRRDAFVALGAAAAPIVAQLIVMLLVHGPADVWYDIGSLARVFRGELNTGSREKPLYQLLAGYWALFGLAGLRLSGLGQFSDWAFDFLALRGFHLAGLVGILLAPPGWRRRWLLGALLGMSLLVVATRGDRIGVFYYPALLFLPFLMLGFGMLASVALDRMERLCRDLGRAPAFFTALVALPFLLFLLPSVRLHWALLSGRFDLTSAMGTQFSVQNERNLDEVVAFVNERVQPQDLVVATPLVEHNIACHVASVRQLVAYSGKASDQYFHDIPRDRFVVDLEPGDVAYLVTDAYFRWHTMTLLNVFPMVLEMEQDAWPLVYWSPWYRVYAGPKARGENRVLDADPMIVDNSDFYAMWAEDRRWKKDWEGCLWGYRRAARSLKERLDYEEEERKTPEMYTELATYYGKVQALEKHLGNTEAAAEAGEKTMDAKREALRLRKKLEEKMMEQAGRMGR